MPMQGVYATGSEFWVSPRQFYLRIDLASSGVADYEAGVMDGVAWQAHPMSGTSKLEGDEAEARLRRASLNPFDAWKEHFETAETVAEEIVGEKACYKVVLTPADGPTLEPLLRQGHGPARPAGDHGAPTRRP